MTFANATRRLTVALLGVAISALIFRSAVASALVTRGDEFLYRSQLQKARLYYFRALTLDGKSKAALDRYVFFGLQIRTRSSLEESVALTSAFLLERPLDSEILADRALCYQFLRRDARARENFERAARVAGDPRYFTLAGWAAKRLGEAHDARRLFLLALRANPGFRPARFALARLSESP